MTTWLRWHIDLSQLLQGHLHNSSTIGVYLQYSVLTTEWYKGLLFALHAPPQDSKRGACWKWSIWVLKAQNVFLCIKVLVNVGMCVEIEHFVGTRLNLQTFTTRQCSITTSTIQMQYGWYLARTSDLKAIQWVNRNSLNGVQNQYLDPDIGIFFILNNKRHCALNHQILKSTILL